MWRFQERTWTRSWRRIWYWMNQKNYSTYCSSPFLVHLILNEPQKTDLNPKLEKILILNELKKTTQHIVQILFGFIGYWMNQKRTWNRCWRRFWYWMNQKNSTHWRHFLHAQCVEIDSKEASYFKYLWTRAFLQRNMTWKWRWLNLWSYFQFGPILKPLFTFAWKFEGKWFRKNITISGNWKGKVTLNDAP